MAKSPDVLSRMRSDWDRRAAEDHKLHIATGHAGSEETFRASGEQDLEEIVLDGIVLERSAEVLEIGCGVGRLLVPLARRVTVAHGVDISPVMIEKSKTLRGGHAERENRAHGRHASRTSRTPPSISSSRSSFSSTFPIAAPIRRYVEEAARVLKPGGVFRFQVDGRWWWKHPKGGPDTYQGVKFSPKDVRELLAGTPFSVVDEWGAEGHYHWITARKAGDGAAASVRPRGWDLPLFASLLRRLGSKRPEKDAAKIRDRNRIIAAPPSRSRAEAFRGGSGHVRLRGVSRTPRKHRRRRGTRVPPLDPREGIRGPCRAPRHRHDLPRLSGSLPPVRARDSRGSRRARSSCVSEKHHGRGVSSNW